MSTQTTPPKDPSRRTFLGWWLGTLLAATVVAVVGPVAVYLFPPRDPKLLKQTVRVALDRAIANIKEGAVSQFSAPNGTAAVIRTAIVNPYLYIPSGYTSGVMPNTFSKTLRKSQLAALVAFLSSVTH